MINIFNKDELAKMGDEACEFMMKFNDMPFAAKPLWLDIYEERFSLDFLKELGAEIIEEYIEHEVYLYYNRMLSKMANNPNYSNNKDNGFMTICYHKDLKEKKTEIYIRVLYHLFCKIAYQENYPHFGMPFEIRKPIINNEIKNNERPYYGYDKKIIAKDIKSELQGEFDIYFKNRANIFLTNFEEDAKFGNFEAPYPFLNIFQLRTIIESFVKTIEYLDDIINVTQTIESLQPTAEINEEPINIETKQKLVLLKKLGVIDLLMEHEKINQNASKVGKIIHQIIGGNQSTVKRYTRNICSENDPQNPMKNKNHSDYIDAILLKILK